MKSTLIMTILLLTVVVTATTTTTTTSSSSTTETATRQQQRRRPSAGGYRAINTTDPEVVKVAATCVQELNQRANSAYPLQLKQVETAAVQVVAGLNVKVMIQVEAVDQTGAVVLTMRKECLVWDRFGKMKVTSLVDADKQSTASAVALDEQGELPLPSPSMLTGAMAGGWRKVNVDTDQRLPAITTFCLERLNAMSNSVEKYTLVKVLSAEVQVVAGMKWKVTLTARRGSAATEMHTFTVWHKVDRSMQLLEHFQAQA